MEQDIEILEKYIDRNIQMFEDYGTKAIIQDREIQAIEHLIKAYKEQNDIIKTANIAIKDLQQKLENSIPVSLVEEKIEELNKRIEKYREYVEQGIETDIEWVDNVADRQVVRILEELLEMRK